MGTQIDKCSVLPTSLLAPYFYGKSTLRYAQSGFLIGMSFLESDELSLGDMGNRRQNLEETVERG